MKGKLIVFDGNDGSGKQTQLAQMMKRLEGENLKVRTIDFPQYKNNFFGQSIADGQCGDFGADWTELDPHLVSIFYAGDRFETKGQIESWLNDGYTVILDRYVSANQIHQGQKIEDEVKRREFLAWLEKMEYGIFKIPKPNMIIYFDVPLEVSLENLKTKLDDTYKNGREDRTETSTKYLTRSRECAQWLASQHNLWHVIDCAPEGDMRSIEDIHEDVYKVLSKELENS
jgi:dTMP kinase